MRSLPRRTLVAGLAAFAAAGVAAWGRTSAGLTPLPTAMPQFDEYKAFIRGPSSIEAVALTFDDGPDKDTSEILRVLAKHRARATFFMIGKNVAEHPEWAKAVAEAGQEIGNHTYDHLDMCDPPRSKAKDREDFLTAQVSSASRAIQDATGVTPTLVRVPYACRSGWIENRIRDLGYTVVRWSVDGDDWKRPGAAAIATYYLQHAAPGAVLIFHDGGGDRSQTAQALETILAGLKERGLRPVTAGELLRLTLPAPSDAGR